jgi:hypothetical protein
LINQFERSAFNFGGLMKERFLAIGTNDYGQAYEESLHLNDLTAVLRGNAPFHDHTRQQGFSTFPVAAVIKCNDQLSASNEANISDIYR